MATTLLAIDDSVTIRKVLEMTFAGEDFRVVTADGADAALAKLRAERPAVVLCDVTLDGGGGYGLCAKIKAENPGVAVVVMASKQQPYDGQKGQASRADDYVEKPFDTQQLIDKVKRLVTTRPVTEAPAPAARPASPGGGTQPGVPTFGAPPVSRPVGTVPMGARPPAPPATAAAAHPRPTAPGTGPTAFPAVQQQAGRGTLSYGGTPSVPVGAVGPGPAARPPMPAAVPPLAPLPAPLPAQVTAAAPAAHAPLTAAVTATATNGQLAAKLTHLGLTDIQVSAVLALSREIVEKVVWEVVPVLAETIIKEEIKRLTSE